MTYLSLARLTPFSLLFCKSKRGEAKHDTLIFRQATSYALQLAPPLNVYTYIRLPGRGAVNMPLRQYLFLSVASRAEGPATITLRSTKRGQQVLCCLELDRYDRLKRAYSTQLRGKSLINYAGGGAALITAPMTGINRETWRNYSF